MHEDGEREVAERPASGIMIVATDPPRDEEAAFHDWYADHIRDRAKVPGFSSIGRFEAVEGVPRFLAIYELDDLAALDHPDYLELKRDRSPAEIEMIARIPLLDRRIYRTLDDQVVSNDEVESEAEFLLMVGMTVRESEIPDLHAWYREEHIPDLIRLPGWLRSRRFERVYGVGQEFLALHELSNLDVLQSDEFIAARTKPWRQEIMWKWISYDRTIWSLRERFEGSTMRWPGSASATG